ncbi:AI-2E family transporter [Parabacteroides pacaensis]|uniref:AI-2E family transporter n=1 Tax=Parabacteroides pacaensis TaxID=2086575 RepID=UPI000D0FDB51|nr:AI-2E family transporter [Parabacteroides pacaensis]
MSPSFNKPFTFDRVVRIFFSILIIGVVIYLLAVLRTALLPFLIAWLLAYILQPLVGFFQYKVGLKSRVLAIIAVILSVVLVVGLLTWSIIPSISDEIDKTVELMRSNGTDRSNIPFIPQSWIDYLKEHIHEEEIEEFFNRDNLLNAIKEIAPQLWALLSNTFSVILSITVVFITFLYLFFILLDYEKIANGWLHLVPQKYRPFVKGLSDDVEASMKRYFRGQTLVAFCVGVLLAIGFKIISFPLAVSLGLFIGLLNLVPYLQTLGIVPMLLLSLLKSAETGENFWIIFGLSVLVLGIVQLIQDLYLTPRIMGKAMGLNPAVILLSLSIWGTLLGFIGLIVALPLTTLVLSYYKRFVLHEHEGLQDNLTSLPLQEKPREEVESTHENEKK